MTRGLGAAGVDRRSAEYLHYDYLTNPDDEQPRHPKSPAGDRRNRAATCSTCRRTTWNFCGLCNRHCRREGHQSNDRPNDR